jgi:hypothetical protein
MRTFYDFRDSADGDATKYPMQGIVILKSKKYWLCWIYKDKHCLNQYLNKGFIVAPRTIYLYNIYIAKSFWDALKYYLILNKQIKNK